MRIVIASDSFKGSLSAQEVCAVIKETILSILEDCQVVAIPIADGGEGTVDAYVKAMDGRIYKTTATGPLGDKIETYFGLIDGGKTAVIEAALVAGLTLIPAEKRNPLVATTYGAGELIKSALDLGCRKIIVGIGGSATNDAGAGMCQALGVKFLDLNQKQIGFGGGALAGIRKIDASGIDSRIKETEIIVACDVDNPLLGEKGASRVFGPQKGATPEIVEILESNLSHFADVVEKDLGMNIRKIPGGGAAGGLGIGLMVFLQAKLKNGIETVIEATNLEYEISRADIVITGEGCIDEQTSYGKAPLGVAGVAKKYSKPVVAVVGSAGPGYEKTFKKGIDVIVDIIVAPVSVEDAMKNAKNLLENAVRQFAKTLILGKCYL